ncbi:MAG: hypothetical protein KME27_00475 [Lyngbya sp. HA4199-MV5]|nr:hypothetical protein [Lyngbya sp. HA4199-MV5]
MSQPSLKRLGSSRLAYLTPGGSGEALQSAASSTHGKLAKLPHIGRLIRQHNILLHAIAGSLCDRFSLWVGTNANCYSSAIAECFNLDS